MTVPPPFAAIPPRGLPELKEHDACALAAFATRDGRPSRDMLERALRSLQMMVHRSGSVDGEGDGSGLMVDLPRPAWRRRLEAEGVDPAAADDRRFTVAHIFFDSTAGAEGQVPRIVAMLAAHGFEVLWNGEGTVDRGALGPRAAETPPIFWQIACLAPGPAASTACYRAMVEIERDVDCHVASFSANDAVYKVQGQPEVIPRFYPEMQEPDFASSRIIAHNRYSTNTYPTFSRVQPFSILGHNGEINTIAQLREQSEQLGLPTTRDGSDSQDLNRLLEGLIFEKGLSLLEAVEFALPPILGEVHRLPAKLQDLYVHYREALGPYAQGPVALAARAADEMVFSVDALGLRPLWWIETGDLYVVSSEPGIVPVAELTRDPAPLAPGEKIALLTGEDGVPVVLDYWDLQREVYRRAKGRGALPTAETRARLAGGLEPVAVEEYPDEDLLGPELDLETLLASAGWIESDKQQLQFHADRGAEPIGSLGWDGPLGPFTPVPMPLSDYFQETVAVVTNPAIDREREVEHFSTRVVLGRRPPIEGVEPEPPQRCELRMPMVLGGMRAGATTLSLPDMRRVAVGQGVACMEDVLAAWGWRAVRLPLHFPAGQGVREHLAHLSEAAVAAVAEGAELIVLQDIEAGRQDRVCDPHLAVAAVDRALRAALKEDGSSRRRDASLVLQAAGIRNVHDVMVALGFGAQALCPYAMMEKAMDGSPEPTTAAANVLEGLQKGMEKVLSTLGIHELRGYGRLVSAIGVAPEVLEVLAIPGFCASEGRGLGLDDLDALAEQGRQIRAGEESPAKVKLPRMYPKVWKALARVATSERGYEELAETLDRLEAEQPVALRHAVEPQLAPPEARLAADAVSARVGEHTLPFLISSMSFGSQGETAFRAYAEAAFQADMLCMNGEGGEIPDMYGRYPKHRGQQIASGRFGVSSLLINSSEWIEIKIGQGAKPGEGGHLPGSKVTQAIARARNAQVGSDLISPSNNHDLYSIEDLAQLIDELKTSNPHAKVIVKVPVVPGIGTIAIGIAKAGADVITMSGYDGGTGAARQHALRRAGLPCEIGTVLAHHALTEAGIRDRVEIWADGGLRSANDCIKLICMGANRLGFGTASMVAIGCTICRGCQLDTCHVGIATQIDGAEEAAERGIKRFVPRLMDPSVAGLVRYFSEMGAALRDLAGRMGVSEVQDLVGHADRLVQVSHHDRLDLTSLLTPVRERVITSPAGTPRFFREFHPPPPHRAPEVAAARLAAGVALAVEEEATTAADRNLGTDLAGLIARATTGVNNAWVNGAGSGVSPTNGAPNGEASGGNGAGDAGNGAGNGHLATLVDLAFTKGAAVGSGLAAFTLDGVRVRVFGGAQDGVGKCALGGEIQVLKARNDAGDWIGGHVGKSFAYGAQRGLFLIQGNADARAGIRLSGADMVLGGEPSGPLNDRLGTLAARSNCKGFAFEYMTGGRVVVLGDPGPWLCSGMTGGVVYVRQNPDWGLDAAAVRRRLSKAAKVSLAALDETDDAAVRTLLGSYQEALRASGQDEAADGVQRLVDEPAAHFIAIIPVTQQADPNISTE